MTSRWTTDERTHVRFRFSPLRMTDINTPPLLTRTHGNMASWSALDQTGVAKTASSMIGRSPTHCWRHPRKIIMCTNALSALFLHSTADFIFIPFYTIYSQLKQSQYFRFKKICYSVNYPSMIKWNFLASFLIDYEHKFNCKNLLYYFNIIMHSFHIVFHWLRIWNFSRIWNVSMLDVTKRWQN